MQSVKQNKKTRGLISVKVPPATYQLYMLWKRWGVPPVDGGLLLWPLRLILDFQAYDDVLARVERQGQGDREPPP